MFNVKEIIFVVVGCDGKIAVSTEYIMRVFMHISYNFIVRLLTSVLKRPHYCLYHVPFTVLKFLFPSLRTKLVVLLPLKYFTFNSVLIFRPFKGQLIKLWNLTSFKGLYV